MGKLFQVSVEKKYLKELNEKRIDENYNKFLAYFGNKEQQERIRNLKEEQYQEGFLRDLFVEILGYTLNPKEGWNLTTELKNVTGSKKADGAIMKNDEAIAVIELKSTSTTNLDKVEEQAFNYKNHHPNCKYIITSNFEKLRFYIQNAVDHQEFDLFSMTKEDFALLWLCLSKDNIFNDLPLKVKDASIFQEEKVTDQLYKDYSMFREQLYLDILENNPDKDKLLLFKKTQKLLDRFLFIFFAEDRFLLPPNSISKIIEQWEQQSEWGDDVTLYQRFKKYFTLLNKGWKGKEYEIFPYNGGLFLPDELLDSIKIGDEVLKTHTMKLTAYNFNPDTSVKAGEEKVVDVNILGHIFEHSIGEIENVQAEIKGEKAEKQKSKRKKHGIFYTPKYITKYIVENTVGKLCREKYEELGIVDEDYAKGRKNRKKTTIKALDEKLNTYREWLLSLTICDPACGSGAFLNQALDFLMEEHRKIDELRAQLFGEGVIFPDITNDILENNLYGVDLNEESVEIAKLSLWLRTAKKGRKLNTLSNNIKCGDSLIDDPSVAGDKAFKWEGEFPEVFGNGGFDVIIGNPPYGADLRNRNWLKEKFQETSFGTIDSYKYFIQLGSSLVKLRGALGYIVPESYLNKEYFRDLRVFISDSFENIRNVKLGDDVFEDVNLPTSIIISSNKGKQLLNYYYSDISKIEKSRKQIALIDKMLAKRGRPDIEKTFIISDNIIKYENTIPLIEVYDQVMGVKVYQKGKGKPKQTKHEIENNVFIFNKYNKTFNYPYISHGINRYFYKYNNEFISYGEWLAEPRKKVFFDQPKIIVREIVNPRIYATYINEPAVVKNIAAVIIEKNNKYPLKFLLGLINSKLFTYIVFISSPKSSNKSYPSFNSKLLKNLPIAICSKEVKEELSKLVNYVLERIKKYEVFKNEFYDYILMKFNIETISSKISNWQELEFKEFLKELKKAKVKLSLQEEAEWMQYFKEQKQKAQSLKAEIEKTDKEIDRMVYGLYGLTEEEIRVVEESVV